jgi:oxygen-independent coproporphyrinogen-3 oxidase
VRAGLYVHIPFCVTKCPYCAFHSTTDRLRRRDVIAAITKEAALRSGRLGPFDTLYLGGGTPSCLELELIAELVEGLAARVPLAPPWSGGVEWTVELNPDDATPELLAGLRGLGFGRVSLGVQSFRDEELAFLGRRHDARTAEHAIEMARAAGFPELSLDLMYGLGPEQTDGEWRESLDRALVFEPEHLSCYQLTITDGTPFHERASRGELRRLDEERAAELFRLTSGHLSARGYEHYEVSSFARGPVHRARHNQRYWRHVPYLGLGPGAHGFDGARRWWNVTDLGEYVERVGRGETPEAGSEVLTPEQLRLEALFLGFRTSDGVPVDVLRGIARWEDTARELESEGLTRFVADRLIPTLDGLLVADALPLRFDV